MVEGVVLPIILALIMVGVGLGLNPRGLVVESIRPKPLLLALSGLLVAMPLAGLAAASLFRGDEGLRIGLMLLVMSPVGLLAAPLTGCRRGNVPVALSLTLITGLIYVARLRFLSARLFRPRARRSISSTFRQRWYSARSCRSPYSLWR
jgi:BASS family bile acid:Na+ symporter